jgi:hypothetical protein
VGAFLGVAFLARLAGPSILVAALRLGVALGLASFLACREHGRGHENKQQQQQTDWRMHLVLGNWGLKDPCWLLLLGGTLQAEARALNASAEGSGGYLCHRMSQS